MVKLFIAGLVIVAGIVVYKLWKAGKAVTGSAVVAGVESEVKAAAEAVKPAVEEAAAKVFEKK